MGRQAGVTAEETRRRLADAAAAVFAREGYERTRVSDVAREAGMSTGAIYSQFRNKADLMAEAIGTHGPTEMRSLLSDLGADATAADVLIALGRSLAGGKRPRKSGRPMLVEAVVAANRDPKVATMVRDHLGERERRLVDLFEAAASAGDLDGELSADALARLCLTLALGSFVVRALDMPGPDQGEWTAVIGRLVHALEPQQTERQQLEPQETS